MRRLAAKLLKVLAATTLLLCAATLLVWVRSYWTVDEIAVGGPERWSLKSYRGSIIWG